MPPLEVELTALGSLLLPAELALHRFPADLVAARLEPGELWLYPLRGAGAGGLLLKRRNAAGDRAVLLGPMLPPRLPAGRCPPFWDSTHAALRVSLPAPPGPGADEPAC